MLQMRGTLLPRSSSLCPRRIRSPPKPATRCCSSAAARSMPRSLCRWSSAWSSLIYFDQQGKPKPRGTRLVNRAYGATLRALALEGVSAFYRGPIAAEIVRAVRSHAKPGDLSEEDLAGYRVLEREPVCGPYRQWRLCSMGPPSAGGVAVLQILGLLERAGFERAAPDSAAAVHLFA